MMKKWKVRVRHAGQVVVGVIEADSAKTVKRIIEQRKDVQLIEIKTAK